MSRELLLLLEQNVADWGIETNQVRDAMRNVPDCEWTEAVVFRVIGWLERYRRTPVAEEHNAILFECIPERCKTHDVWVEMSVNYPPYLKRVPPKIATQEFYEDVMRRNPMIIGEVPRHNRTPNLCRIAIGNSEYTSVPLLKYIPYESQTEELILETINVHGGNELVWAAFQTRTICMRAVETHPTSIVWVNDQTFDICERAIQVAAGRENYYEIQGEVVELIRKHTPEICAMVVREMYWGLGCLRIQSRELCLEAIQRLNDHDIGQILVDIREQTLEICLAAYRRQRRSYASVRDAVMCRNMVRLVLTIEALIPLHNVGLSTSLLTEVCEQLMPDKFPPALTRNPQLLTPVQMWALAAKVKHAQ
ncbi:MAG: hypothetical protein WC052_04445 [Patescibacteria group bacterium]